jgi:tRNA G18 (ribose-2'-O)-methylase SpoU
MAKTALGSDMQIPWEQHWNGVAAIDKIKVKGYHLIGLEYTQNSKLLFDINFTPVTPCLLIAGNENFGIDPDILAQCDQTVHIPMAGIKQSLNVAIAFSIAAYWILYGAG